jgi:uncharacterized protein YeeX (DUF496 family)
VDHVWRSLKEWESIWEERVENEKKVPYNEKEVELLTEQLASIRKAMKEVGKWN